MQQAINQSAEETPEELSERLAQRTDLSLTTTKAGHQTLVVTFDGPNDSYNPQNWTPHKKLKNFVAYTFGCFATSFSSGVLSPAVFQIAKHFHISTEVALLSTSTLFLLGYSAGPFLWGPSSDYYGRKLPMLVAYFGAVCFGAGASASTDYQTLAICRFFQGAMGACGIMHPLAAFADMFDAEYRGYSAVVFGFAVFVGPMTASPIGGFTVDNTSLGWRWCSWWTVFTTVAGLLCLGLVDESYAPYLLKLKAMRLRSETGEFSIHASHEAKERNIRQTLKLLATLPFKMAAKEPILLLISIYVAFVYSLLYTFLVSYSIVFVEGYHMNAGLGGLPFLGLIAGCAIGVVVNLAEQRRLNTRLMANGGIMVPEWRMPLCTTGAVAFAIGLFWFAWTAAYPKHIHWIAPTLSGLSTGYGLQTIFFCTFSFILEVYKSNAAPAMAVAAIARSFLAAGFPMFARQMFDNLGIQWANTLLACIATVLIPVPIAFWRWGPQIRARSSFAMNATTASSASPKNLGPSDEETKGED